MAAEPSDIRRSAFLLLMVAAVAIAAAKTVGAENVIEPSRYKAAEKGGYGAEPDRKWPDTRPDPVPTFSSNDKSRWATVRAIVHDRTFVIGKRTYPDPKDPKKYKDEGIVAEPAYKSLDIVMNPETKEFYSSKPPLMSVLVACEYWVLNKGLDWDIVKDRWLVIPAIVLTWNVLPFLVYLVLLGKLLDVTGKTDFGKLLAFAVASVGTFLLTFSGTLNNHLPAAYCILFASYPLLRAIAENRDMTPAGYCGCGFFSALAATFELPALAFFAAIFLPLFIARPRNTILFFTPCALLPFAALFAANYAALGKLLPAYSEFGGPWYNFEGSHWAKRGTPAAKGIDFNDEPTTVYAFHLTLGHHGWFSLTPVWLIAFVGLLVMGIKSAPAVQKLFSSKKGTGTGWTPELFAAMTLVVSVAVFAFYLTRVQSYNYGGNTSGPRWLFWLIPLWVLAIPPAADRLARSEAGRLLCALLLGFGVLSVFYPAWNPWRNPWILQLMEYNGWLRY
ncbi:hypothetical protein J8F10_12580 [Gemmata sp. G18]|uniref:Glycosyltransferase RgtA/B/C/D-like domain-containing protein n=1 Tax=Gemmata palustris TaxID=2822762 RepID=A0ABS5BR06_9BACT|nr:hypothetical protein [Gemmata palustris]MBP3956119.1 hypothetical protein [Gemmata palustris]